MTPWRHGVRECRSRASASELCHDRERRRPAEDASACHPPRLRRRTSQPTGIATNIEASRSMNPPCPGRKFDMSFNPTSRLIRDSTRSPSVAAGATHNPRTRPSPQDAPRHQTVATAPIIAAVIMEPANPSHVLEGEMCGAILCFPSRLPTAYAPVSEATTQATTAMIRRVPPGSAIINGMKTPISGM